MKEPLMNSFDEHSNDEHLQLRHKLRLVTSLAFFCFIAASARADVVFSVLERDVGGGFSIAPSSYIATSNGFDAIESWSITIEDSQSSYTFSSNKPMAKVEPFSLEIDATSIRLLKSDGASPEFFGFTDTDNDPSDCDNCSQHLLWSSLTGAPQFQYLDNSDFDPQLRHFGSGMTFPVTIATAVPEPSPAFYLAFLCLVAHAIERFRSYRYCTA